MASIQDTAQRPVLTRVERWLSDAVLGMIIFGAVSWMIYADLAGERPPDVFAYSGAFALGALMLLRRQFPLVVLGITIAGVFGYYAAGYPAIGLGVPLAGALLSTAQFRRVGWALAALALTFGISYSVRLAQGQDAERIIGYELVGELGIAAAAIALGVSLRLRRQVQESSRRLQTAAAEQERVRAMAAAAQERAEIARELHDALGHHATVVSMHADVIGESVGSDPDTARQSAHIVKQTSREMLTELRRTVRTLRRGVPASAREVPGFSLESLQKAVFDPLPITVTADIDVVHGLPGHVQSAALRILQEALTNVVKHSRAGAAQVRIRSSADGLHLTVSDRGPHRSAPEPLGADVGLHSMRERAEALGGSFSAEPVGAGFRVQTLLPLEALADTTEGEPS